MCVATGHQFPIQLSDIVAASFPAFIEKGQVWIKQHLSWARFLFGEHATAQPARDRGMGDSYLIGDSGL